VVVYLCRLPFYVYLSLSLSLSLLFLFLSLFPKANNRVDWESMEAHQAMIESPGYGPFLERVGVIMAGPPDLKHAVFTIYGTDGELSIAPSTVFKDTATVIEKFYFPLSVDVAAVDAATLSLVRSITETKGFKVVAKGWQLEKGEHEALGGLGLGKVLVMVTGFKTVENASTFGASKDHKDKIRRAGAKADECYVACL